MRATTLRIAAVLVLSILGSVALVISSSAPTAAHTGLDSSLPSDGDIVDKPVWEISLTFTRSVEPVGDGCTVFDEHGLEQRPESVSTADGPTWILNFETPLAGGLFEVSWRVVAADGHIAEGTFTFSVTVEAEPVAATPAGAGETSSGDTTVGSTGTDIEPVESMEPVEPIETSSRTADQTRSSTAGAQDLDETGPIPPTNSAAPVAEPASESPQTSATSSSSADSATDSASPLSPRRRSTAAGAQRLEDATRVLGLLATLVIVGGFAFVSFVVRDDPYEKARAHKWAGASGLVLAASAVAAALSRVAVVEDDWSAIGSTDAITDVLATQFGVVAGLRLLGGLAVFAVARGGGPNRNRFRITLLGLFGAACVIASYAFDGHTITHGPRWLHAVASVAHVSAAGVWSGGIAMLAALLWRCRRNGADVIQPLMRFSRLAATALVLAGVAGTAMAVFVMDRFADLWSTPWGRLLLAKIALVAVAAFLGARNRWVSIPAARQITDQQRQSLAVGRLHRTVFAEAVALGCVGVITAFLVVASPT